MRTSKPDCYSPGAFIPWDTTCHQEAAGVESGLVCPHPAPSSPLELRRIRYCTEAHLVNEKKKKVV